jgi:hypothetical protein
MKNDYNIHESLLDAMKEKLPPDANPATVLADILYMGKESVYRRLRGDVSFTLMEAVMISKALNLSLDKIIGLNTGNRKHFRMKLIDYSDPQDIDYAILQNFIDMLNSGRDDPYSEFIMATNIVPQIFYMRYDRLVRFAHFKWAYYQGQGYTKTFEETQLPDRLKAIHRDSIMEHMLVKTSSYVLDRLMLLYWINDIRYFATAHLISEDSVKKIKQDLHRMLNYMEDVATSALFETGTGAHLYVSNINIENTYTCLRIHKYRISMVDIFLLNTVASLDDENYERVKAWLQSYQKTSTKISRSGELHRIGFFKEQRNIVDSL